MKRDNHQLWIGLGVFCLIFGLFTYTNCGSESSSKRTENVKTPSGGGTGEEGEEGEESEKADFISVWRTTQANETIELPLREGFEYNMTVDWGDDQSSEIDHWDHPEKVHMYEEPGDYTVTISGLAQAWYFNGVYSTPELNIGNEDKIIHILDLGDLGWINFENAFRGCQNLETVQGGNTSTVTHMGRMFADARVVEPDTSSWDTSNVTNMGNMFVNAHAANPDTSSWDTSNVTLMNGMFFYAHAANPDTSSWDTSNVISMAVMFYDAMGPNPDVSGWDFQNVTSMTNMFIGNNAFSTENYTNMLLRIQETTTKMNVTLDAPQTQYYSEAANARSYLVDQQGWTINDAGQSDEEGNISVVK